MLERSCPHQQYGAVENRNSGVDMGVVPTQRLRGLTPLVANTAGEISASARCRSNSLKQINL